MEQEYIQETKNDSMVKSSEEITYKRKVAFLFILMMLDFIATYVGINHYEFVEEANPIMVWLFEMPFEFGMVFRGLYAAGLAWISLFIFKSGYKHYNAYINFALTVNAAIAFVHMRWMTIYLAFL